MKTERLDSQLTLRDCSEEVRREAGYTGVLQQSPGYCEEEKLKFYITSCSSCLCNSSCCLQSLDHVGHVVSESGDLKYQELELISLTFVLLFATAQPLQSCLIIPVHVKVRRPPPHLDCYSCVHMKPLSLNQPISSQCCPLQSVYKNSVIPLFRAQSLEC